MKTEQDIVLEDEITELLLCSGIPANMKGFRYLKAAVAMACKNPEVLDHITRQIYPVVAQEQNTKPQLVERCVRHCVLRAFESGAFSDIQEFSKKFSNKKPCNSEAIAIFAQIVRKRMNQKALMYKKADTNKVSQEKYDALRQELEYYKRMYGDLR